MVETLLAFTLAMLGVKFVTVLVRRTRDKREALRRIAARGAYRAREEAARQEQADAAVRTIVDRFFPFARTAWQRTAGQRDPRSRLRQALSECDAVELGDSDIGFQAVLPIAERRKHLIGLGKSGYGKTSIALRLIQDDLVAGRGLCILGSEAELFRDWLLPLVPANRANQLIAFRPADPRCTLTWNPLAVEDGDDLALAAGELFAIFKRSIGEDSIGARADAILSSAFAVLVGRPGATLWTVVRFLEDETFRASVVEAIDDPYLRDFWTKTFPEYPTGAVLPLANRLNQFLRQPQVRAALCHPVSSFSVRDALAKDRILFFDVSGLDPDATRLVGQMLLSKFQLELMRRERVPEAERRPVHVYVDEFHVFADAGEGTWRELLARGRRYGLGLHLFTQHPNQLPRSLHHEIFGNVSSVIALNLSGNDAAAVRRELLVPVAGGGVKSVPAEEFVSLAVGEGFARLGSGACALKVKFAPPIERPDAHRGDRIREDSWRRYAAPPLPSPPEPVPSPSSETVAVPPPDPSVGGPGRGGAKHKLLQRLVREWGEARGFRASVEEEILGGAGRLDVALVRGDVRIAVEVAVTSTADQIIASVTKALAAGYTNVVILTAAMATLPKTEAEVAGKLEAHDRDRVRFFDPDGMRAFLDAVPRADAPPDGPAGYTLKIEAEPVSPASYESRRRAIARLIGAGLLRQERPS